MGYILKGIGDKLTGKNDIIPTFDAKIFNFYSQMAPGVVGSESNKFPVTIITRGVTIGPGLAHAYGYFGMSDAPVQFNFVIPSTSTQYAKVYAEFDLSARPQSMAIKVTPQSDTSVIELISDNLSTLTTGIYQIPLYLVTIKTDASITCTDLRTILNRVSYAGHSNNSDLAANSQAVNSVVVKKESTKLKADGDVVSRREILYSGSFGISSATSLTLNKAFVTGDLIRFTLESEYPNSQRFHYAIVGNGSFFHLQDYYVWGSKSDYFYITHCEVTGLSNGSKTLSFAQPYTACVKIPDSGSLSTQFKNSAAIAISEIARIIE